MLVIDNGNIKLTRGDTAVIGLTIRDLTGEQYRPSPADLVQFTVRKYATSEIVLQKTLRASLLEIKPEDTSSLPFGTYRYDIQLTKGKDVFTVVGPCNFNVSEEVTY